MNKDIEKYDLAVVYRIYPGVSKIPIIHPNNKSLPLMLIKQFDTNKTKAIF